MMSNRLRCDMTINLLKDVQESLARYESVKSPVAGYTVDREDSKESIIRRIRVVREELLKISKDLQEGG